MSDDQAQFEFDNKGNDAELLTGLLDRSESILVKKLSNNDRDWARFKNKHQAGVYIPHEQRDGGFFPALEAKARDNPEDDEIRERFFTTIWPQSGFEERQSRLVHYTSKGQETHLTRLPKAQFGDLLPASFFVMGRMQQKGGLIYHCLTIDSGSDEAALLADLLDLGPDFLVGVFDPVRKKEEERDRVLAFAEQVIAAWLAGTIDVFARDFAAMPPTIALARMAQEAFLKKYGLETINPFAMDHPGDALREISRSIEWDLFRDYQRRERSVELVRIVLGDVPVTFTSGDVIRLLIDQLPAIDALMLSASQQRKSRAGYSYEHHIETMLAGGGIPFEKQVIIEAKKRPDFILPSLAFIDSGRPEAATGLILSAKTTLRERWKQVEREKGARALYLTTVGENIASNAIEDMAEMGIFLVIPESLMKSKETEYAGHRNVLSFRDFCDHVVAPAFGAWK
ncbi:MAG: type II restriction endonuclease [Tabrizicola sp.]